MNVIVYDIRMKENFAEYYKKKYGKMKRCLLQKSL